MFRGIAISRESPRRRAALWKTHLIREGLGFAKDMKYVRRYLGHTLM